MSRECSASLGPGPLARVDAPWIPPKLSFLICKMGRQHFSVSQSVRKLVLWNVSGNTFSLKVLSGQIWATLLRALGVLGIVKKRVTHTCIDMLDLHY